jgi:hypothetical protein
MDSKTDAPIILTDEYAEKCAEAIVEVIVKRGKLTKKPTEIVRNLTVEEFFSEVKSLGYNITITKKEKA